VRASFIVPCYNVSKTLCRCLDSIYALGLSEKDFEVLAIDDASTDDTLRLLEGYAGERPNMRIIRHLVNRNLGAARNSGLAEAKGDCIAFVDSDDEVAAGIVEAIRMLEMQNLDMVAMRVEKVNEDGTVEETLSLAYPQDQVFSGIQLQEEHPFWCSAVWGYLFSRTFINSVNYPFVEGVYYEDSDFVCRHLYQAGRMGFSDACGYRFFFSNPASITHTSSPEHIFGYACLGARMLAFYERLEKKTSLFAKSILEGGSFNLMKSFRQLPRLGSVSEVRHFYDMLDSRIDRESLKRYRKPAYCWTFWTRFCLKHRHLATGVAGMMVIV
jgi:Glycosyltransferases involved in cell wall biogenesis